MSGYVNATGGNYTIDLTMFTDVFQNLYIFDSQWVLPMIVIMLSLAIITRDIGKWKILSFPVAIMWMIIGLKVHMLILVGAGVLFVIEALSIEVIGQWVDVLQRSIRKQSKENLMERWNKKSKIAEAWEKIKSERATKKEYKRDFGINLDKIKKTPQKDLPQKINKVRPQDIEKWESQDTIEGIRKKWLEEQKKKQLDI